MPPKFSYLSISKRDADCYDVYFRGGPNGAPHPDGRVAALRADFTEDAVGIRTATPGTWRIRWEHCGSDGRFDRDFSPAVEALRFGSVHEAFAFYCGQVLV